MNQVQRFQRLSARIGQRSSFAVTVTPKFASCVSHANVKKTSKLSSLLELMQLDSADVDSVTLELEGEWRIVFSNCVGKGSFGVAWGGTLSIYRDGGFARPVDVVIKRQSTPTGGRRGAYNGEWAKEYTIAAYIADTTASSLSKLYIYIIYIYIYII
jgi:hypothetical protein